MIGTEIPTLEELNPKSPELESMQKEGNAPQEKGHTEGSYHFEGPKASKSRCKAHKHMKV